MSVFKDLLAASLPTTKPYSTVWWNIDLLRVHSKRDTFESSTVHYHCSIPEEAEWCQGTESSTVLSQSRILCALRVNCCLSSATLLWLAPLQLSSKSGISSLAALAFPLTDFLTKYPSPLSLSALTILILPLSLHASSLFHSAATSELFHISPWYSFPVSCLSSRVKHSSSLDLLWTGRPQSIRIISHCAPVPVFMLTQIGLIFPPHCFSVPLLLMLHPSTPQSAPGYNSTIFFLWQQFFLIQTLELLFSAQFSSLYYHAPTLLPLCIHITGPDSCGELYWWV